MKVCVVVSNLEYMASTVRWFSGIALEYKCLNKKRKFALERKKEKVLLFSSLHVSIRKSAREGCGAEREKRGCF